MKLPLGPSVSDVRRRSAFTLIELLAVMAIILVLAGLIINIAGSAQYNSAKSRAMAEINALSTALENYKTDNGTYPPDPNTLSNSSASVTGLLNAQTNFDPTQSIYITNSEYLYQVLAGFPITFGSASSTTTATKKYMDFTPQQLRAVNSGDTVTVNNPKMYIVDPFGFSYGYSTIYAAYVAQQNAAGTSTPNTMYGYNPTFDLWSTAGYALGGKSTPTTTVGGGNAAVYSSLWVKNW